MYYIFSNPIPNKKVQIGSGLHGLLLTVNYAILQVPKDWFLFVIVVVVVAGDLLIILIGTAIPSLRLNATRIADVQHPTSFVSTA